MHLILPWAWPVTETLPDPAAALEKIAPLPDLHHLSRLMATWTAGPLMSPLGPQALLDGADPARSLNPPHEHAWAQAIATASNQPVCADGLVPMAARYAAQDGLPVTPANAAHWAMITPCHWQVGTHSTELALPDPAFFSENLSRKLFTVLAPLFEPSTPTELPLSLQWGRFDRWYICHPLLAHIPLAALDRVHGHNVQAFLPTDDGLGDEARALMRRLRRLQAEAQMLLYAHEVHDVLQHAGTWPVNTLWFSGSGDGALWQEPAARHVNYDIALCESAQAGDWRGWLSAWATLDAYTLAPLLRGSPVDRLTLCGTRGWRTWQRAAPPPKWNWLAQHRIKSAAAHKGRSAWQQLAALDSATESATAGSL